MPGVFPKRNERGGSSAGRRAWAVVVSVAAGLLACDAVPAEQPPADHPASGPVVVTIVTDSQPAPEPIARAATVREALEYEPGEKTILADVLDRDGQLDTAALYVLLRRAEMLPEGPQTVAEADRPNVKNFWLEPERYRGRLVFVEAAFVKKQDWSDQATPTQRWSTRPVYMAHVRELVTGEGRPMIVMLTRDLPDRMRPGRRLRFAGLFYKLVTLPEDEKTGGDPSRTHEYPVIVAGNIYARAGSGPGSPGVPTPLVLMFAGVILLLVAFMFLRRRTTRLREGAKKEYKPLRFEDAADRAGSGADPGADDVDEELVRQVRSRQEQERAAAEGQDADERKDSH